jgi:hypothetical protein
MKRRTAHPAEEQPDQASGDAGQYHQAEEHEGHLVIQDWYGRGVLAI